MKLPSNLLKIVECLYFYTARNYFKASYKACASSSSSFQLIINQNKIKLYLHAVNKLYTKQGVSRPIELYKFSVTLIPSKCAKLCCWVEHWGQREGTQIGCSLQKQVGCSSKGLWDIQKWNKDIIILALNT